MSDLDALPPEVRKRLELLEFRLYWEGRVNRRDLTQAFGISDIQASVDFRAYNALCPDAMTYSPKEKRYRSNEGFVPVLYAPDAPRYLAMLCPESAEAAGGRDCWIGSPPPVLVARKIARKPVEAAVLQPVVLAIHYGLEIEIRYQATTHKEDWRWIRPVGLVYSGFRWHCRAWDLKNQRFGDFVLTRILDVRARRDAGDGPSGDPKWQDEITVEIAIDPRLEAGAQKVLAAEYLVGDADILTVDVPKLTLPYFLRLNGIEDDRPDQKPEHRQIVVMNRDQVDKALPEGWKDKA
ncbi:WYL domain-containing protein [Paramagnetospirillum magnetotacticum]|uniref:WYL domain-containing protein n=1 Tax=Paramagnetospirillum magnetotacticum TaxID=188 RepID=UPI000596B4D1|nr:WYL domain-containing protein [Paramagnetospirillum magnetotacticum]